MQAAVQLRDRDRFCQVVCVYRCIYVYVLQSGVFIYTCVRVQIYVYKCTNICTNAQMYICVVCVCVVCVCVVCVCVVCVCVSRVIAISFVKWCACMRVCA